MISKKLDKHITSILSSNGKIQEILFKDPKTNVNAIQEALKIKCSIKYIGHFSFAIKYIPEDLDKAISFYIL